MKYRKILLTVSFPLLWAMFTSSCARVSIFRFFFRFSDHLWLWFSKIGIFWLVWRQKHIYQNGSEFLSKTKHRIWSISKNKNWGTAKFSGNQKISSHTPLRNIFLFIIKIRSFCFNCVWVHQKQHHISQLTANIKGEFHELIIIWGFIWWKYNEQLFCHDEHVLQMLLINTLNIIYI